MLLVLPPPNRSQQQRYLRLLKRRQRASRWRERAAWSAVVVALLGLIAEQMTGVWLAWELAVGGLLLALLFIVLEALDAAHEERQRQQQAHKRMKKKGVQDDS